MTRDRQFIVWSIIVSQFAPTFMVSGVAVAVPSLSADLNAGATSVGLVETLFLTSQLAFLLPCGRLAAAADKKTVYKFGLWGFALSSVLIGLLSSMPLVLALRFFQGLTSAAISATGPAILSDIVPAGERGKAFGASIGALYAGLTLGPICAGFLTDLWGWRAVFIGGGVMLLVMAILIQAVMSSSWQRLPAKTLHIPSVALSTVSVLCLVAGTSMVDQGWPGYAALALGAVLAVAFVALQLRLEEPLLDIELLLRNPVLSDALFVQLLLYTNAFSITFLLSIYMQVTLGDVAQLSGQVIAIRFLFMSIMAPVAGALADRYPARILAACGVGGVLISTTMGIFLDAHSSLFFLIGMGAVHGFAWAMFSSPNMTLIMNSVSGPATSIASALGAGARSLGMVAGMLVAGLLISLIVGNEPIGAHPEGIVRVLTLTCSILTVITAVVFAMSVWSAWRPRSPIGEPLRRPAVNG